MWGHFHASGVRAVSIPRFCISARASSPAIHVLSFAKARDLWSCSHHMAADGDHSRGFASENGWRAAEPASSILAAHFAPRLASQGHDTHQLPRETFAQLRQELLSHRSSQSRGDEGVSDINKLVCIVLKAGLEASPTASALEEGLEGQVLDCLDIIQASVEKAPQALWDTSDPAILGEDVHAPLFAWLILRLIRLSSTWSSEAVQAKIHQVLTSIACFRYKQIRSSPSCSGISAFFRACTSGMSLLSTCWPGLID